MTTETLESKKQVIPYEDNELELLAIYVLTAKSEGKKVTDGVRQFMTETGSTRTEGALNVAVSDRIKKDPRWKDEFAKYEKPRTVKSRTVKAKNSEVVETTTESIVNGVIEETVATEERQERIPMSPTQFIEFMTEHIKFVNPENDALRQEISFLTEQRDLARTQVQSILADLDNAQEALNKAHSKIGELESELSMVSQERDHYKSEYDNTMSVFVRAREYIEGVPQKKGVEVVMRSGQIEAIR